MLTVRDKLYRRKVEQTTYFKGAQSTEVNFADTLQYYPFALHGKNIIIFFFNLFFSINSVNSFNFVVFLVEKLPQIRIRTLSMPFVGRKRVSKREVATCFVAFPPYTFFLTCTKVSHITLKNGGQNVDQSCFALILTTGTLVSYLLVAQE